MRDDIDMSRHSSRRGMLATVTSTAVRLGLLFSTVGIALALFLTPQAERGSRAQIALASMSGDLDMTATGTVPGSRTYTIRRSVLQSSPDAICVIAQNGARSGDC